jgi:flavin reductase (DIM6/NTAB) family NADH-FMN oxidoreductase RutF
LKTLNVSELSTPKLHHYLLGSIGPRPICFASTIDKEGNRNLSPFSFFNVFSANPPIIVFSPARSGRTGETKNTYDNCLEVAEVVVNVVNYSMVQQMSLSSSPYPKDVDEFIKAGFTPIASEEVRPFRVKESPIQMECFVKEIKTLGTEGNAGNLIIAEIVKIHLDESILNEQEMVDQEKIDLVARMGGNYYCRAHGEALFEIPKPITSLGMGIDALPKNIRLSKDLSGNDLGKLGLLEQFPLEEEWKKEESLSYQEAIQKAKRYLDENKIDQAYSILLKNMKNE